MNKKSIIAVITALIAAVSVAAIIYFTHQNIVTTGSDDVSGIISASASVSETVSASASVSETVSASASVSETVSASASVGENTSASVSVDENTSASVSVYEDIPEGDGLPCIEDSNYHMWPVIVKEADYNNPNSFAVMRCDACEKNYRAYLPHKYELSGNESDVIVTTEYGYIDKEDYLVLLDKDIKLPGNYTDILDVIFDRVREKTGLYSDNWHSESNSYEMVYYIDENPWDAIPQKDRIVINMVVDREPIGWISCAFISSFVSVDYEFFSDEIWNSIPDYRDNPWRRSDNPEYGAMIHELTHALTLRTLSSVQMGNILCEGIAQYVGAEVDKELVSEGLAGYYHSSYYDYDQTGDFNVTPENAEALFRNDYHDIDFVNRGAEYDYGRYFCEFLNENYGSDFFLRIVKALEPIQCASEWGDGEDSDRDNRTEAIKGEFGEDVFVKFGKWFKTHKREF